MTVTEVVAEYYGNDPRAAEFLTVLVDATRNRTERDAASKSLLALERDRLFRERALCGGPAAARDPDVWEESDAKAEDVAAEAGAIVLSGTELLSASLPQREPLLLCGDAPVLRKRDQLLLYADRGMGKTWVSLALATMLSQGSRWTRWRAARRATVLYVDGEMPGAAIQDRYRALLAGDTPSPSIRFLLADVQAQPFPSLATIEGEAFLGPWLQDVEVLFLDHVSGLFGRLAENDAEAWAPAQAWLLGLRRRGITVILVHHAGRSGNPRGTTKREDVTDLIVSLRRPSDYIPEHGLRAEVHFEKARGVMGQAVEPFEVRLSLVDGRASWGDEEVGAELFAKVVEMIRQGKTVRAIEQATGIPKSTVSRHASRAKLKGLLS